MLEYKSLSDIPTDQLREFYLKACDMKHHARELYNAFRTETALLAFAAAGDLVEANEVELIGRGGFFEWLSSLPPDEQAQPDTHNKGVK